MLISAAILGRTIKVRRLLTQAPHPRLRNEPFAMHEKEAVLRREVLFVCLL